MDGWFHLVDERRPERRTPPIFSRLSVRRPPYEHLTIIDVEPAGDRTRVVMTIDPLHDEPWTQGYRAHRANELQNLEAAISRRTS